MNHRTKSLASALLALTAVALAACGGSKAAAPPATGRYDFDKGTVVAFTPDEQAVVDEGVAAAAKLPKKVTKFIGNQFVFEDLQPLCPLIVFATWSPQTGNIPSEEATNAASVVFSEGVRFGQVDALKRTCSAEIAAYSASYSS